MNAVNNTHTSRNTHLEAGHKPNIEHSAMGGSGILNHGIEKRIYFVIQSDLCQRQTVTISSVDAQFS